jgi:hypothetical protein
MIASNTAFACPGAGIKVSSGGSGATRGGNSNSTVTNNVIYGNGHGVVETSDRAHPVGPGNRYVPNLVFGSRSGDVLEPGDSLARRAIVYGTISGTRS